jgi:predicted AlkP superfamily phosphohydrolase/phosphomutase
MDPAFVERHWSALPHLGRLRDRGSFYRLATTTPPQSPVAWSTFITGLSAAQHGIYDFVQRDPDTMQPYSSISRTEEPRWMLPIGPYNLPLSSSHVISLRRGTPFWKVLADHGIPVTVIRMPTNYPPAGAGHELSGMGTPDLRGTLGTFTYYTDDPGEPSRSVPGGRIVNIDSGSGRYVLPIEGPPNALRRDHAYSSANLTVDVDADAPVARLKIDGDVEVIREGEWSGWMAAKFVLLPYLSSVSGTFRVFAKQLHPGLQLYVSAINIDPLSPALPISSPAKWAGAIARDIGRFYTMGTPEDTSALRQGVFSLAEFESQTRLVFEEERALLRYSLKHYQDGLLFFYFSVIDQNSHMLWGKHEAELLEVYKAVDECIGEVEQADPAAELIVMSDHGFTTFDRAVHLNAWLQHHGYLNLAEEPGDGTSLSSVKWSSTKAYALGLNGLYLNRSGREEHGVVSSGDQTRALIANLRQQLVAWRDPANGRQVVEAVYPTNAAPNNAAVAPDLIVGYGPGYRASWQTGLGATPAEEIEDNNDAWIGDHCINPVDVPGVLFTNRPIRARDPKLQDVTASILRLFGVPPPSGVDGKEFIN